MNMFEEAQVGKYAMSPTFSEVQPIPAAYVHVH